MKQRITIEQFNELTKEQKQNLKDLWEPKEGDWVVIDSEDGFEEYLLYNDDEYQEYDAEEKVIWGYKFEGGKKLEMCILPSNGQMVEFLEANDFGDGIIVMGINETFGSFVTDTIFIKDVPVKYLSNNLCDALWEAVKVNLIRKELI